MIARLAVIVLLSLVGCNESDDDGSDGAADTSAAGSEGTSGSEGSSGGDEASSSDGGSSGGAGAIVCDELPVITYDTFGAGFLATYCNGCHGGEVINRQGAPAEVVFDTREQASMFAPLILARRMPPEGVMPMPPAGGVVPSDDEKLRIWLTCWP